MYYNSYKNLIKIYNDEEKPVYTILGANREGTVLITSYGQVLITSYGENEKVKYPILLISVGSECIMSDNLTIIFDQDREQRDVIQLVLENKQTFQSDSFYLVYDAEKKYWLDYNKERPY